MTTCSQCEPHAIRVFQGLAIKCRNNYRVAVKQVRLLISTLLLALFALNFGAEIFASRDTSFVCTDQVQSSKNQITHSSITTSDEGQKETKTSNCADPCHFGQSHVGHGAFVSGNGVLSLHPIDQIVIHQLRPQSLVDGPFLEGLRRPPRA